MNCIITTIDLKKEVIEDINDIDHNCRKNEKIELICGSTLKINESTFKNYTNLREIYIPNVQTIERYTFYYCNNLEIVDITNAKNIHAYAFSRCNSLTQVIMNSVEGIGDNAFERCVSLKYVIVPYLKHIGKNAFHFSGLKKFIAYNVKTIDENAFNFCYKLVTLDIKNVEIIKNNAFEGCLELNKLFLDSENIHICSHAFYNCINLKEVHIQNNVSIDQYAFYNCISLETLYIKNATLIGINSFSNTNIRKLIFNGLPEFHRYCFSDCKMLKYVIIENLDELKDVELENFIEIINKKRIFLGCYSMVKIKMNGEFDDIDKSKLYLGLL